MIVTHPFLFNIIVILFIAFTSGWVVYAALGRQAINLKHKLDALKNEKENLRRHAQQLEEELQKRYANPIKSTPVISLSASLKSNKRNDAGI